MSDRARIRRTGSAARDAGQRRERTAEPPSSGGKALEPETRARLEPRFGHSFARVRVHADDAADRLTRDLGAEALTVGTDLFFRDGAYEPASDGGVRLIAHELAHTVQQGAGAGGAELRVTERHDAAEREAEAVASRVTTGGEAQVQVATGPVLARSQDEEHGPDLGKLNEPLNEHAPWAHSPFRLNPLPGEAPSPYVDPRVEGAKEYEDWQSKQRGDRYPNPLVDPPPRNPKDPHDDPSYWNDWGPKPAEPGPLYLPPDPWAIDPTTPPWMRQPFERELDKSWPPVLPAPVPREPGDYPLPPEDDLYS